METVKKPVYQEPWPGWSVTPSGPRRIGQTFTCHCKPEDVYTTEGVGMGWVTVVYTLTPGGNYDVDYYIDGDSQGGPIDLWLPTYTVTRKSIRAMLRLRRLKMVDKYDFDGLFGAATLAVGHDFDDDDSAGEC